MHHKYSVACVTGFNINIIVVLVNFIKEWTALIGVQLVPKSTWPESNSEIVFYASTCVTSLLALIYTVLNCSFRGAMSVKMGCILTSLAT